MSPLQTPTHQRYSLRYLANGPNLMTRLHPGRASSEVSRYPICINILKHTNPV